MLMDSAALSELLEHLIANWENEVVEFKRGKDGFSSDDLGKYATALANEANLRSQGRAWLVFGVDDKTRQVCGTSYKEEMDRLQADKQQVLNGTGSFTFRDIHVLAHPLGRVILFEIPAAPRGMAISWKGHYFGRAGEKPNVHVSAKIAAATENKADYIRTRAQDDEHYARLLCDYLGKFGKADRAEIDRLLTDKLSDALSPEQKQDKISNLLTKLRRQERIFNAGSRSKPEWRLAE